MDQLLSSFIKYSKRFLENISGRKCFCQQVAIVLFTVLFFFFNADISHAQESLRGLSDNPVLIKEGNHISRLKAESTPDPSDTVNLKLPFVDDFSSVNVYPDQKKWINKNVDINSYFPINPVSLGVATFNDLNEKGNLYNHPDSITYVNADTLTSRQINLDFPNRSDIYISFFYEPGGFGNFPEPEDSLILDFYLPIKKTWKKIWGIPGDTISDRFRQTIIHVDDTIYFHKGFRFRFRNLVSIKNYSTGPDIKKDRSNDLWHLDILRLDTSRNGIDTTLRDIIFKEPLKLPFIDDFSSTGAYPDQHIWIDKYVFINSTFPINPPSIGVATFDALDNNGHLYSYADSLSNFNADQLTSRMIDLNFPTRNDIYLSFFYEPGGLGSLPDSGDSLMLDFWSPSKQEWKKIWGISGDTMAHKFRQTLVHIIQPEYLQKGFRFRFRNLVSLGNSSTTPDGKNNSNTDFWHLDYIRIDIARSDKDTTIKDVAFVEPMHSLLKNYQSMPWNHFLKASFKELQKTIKVTYRNNNKIDHNITRNFEVKDMYEPTEKVIFSAGAEDILSGKNFYLETDLPNPFTTTSTDSALFEASSYLITDSNDYKRNDTIRFRQVFSNYFAYDDGTPEYGYGFDNTAGDLGRLAYQFNSYVSDTLVAVRFFFAASKWAKNSNHFFNLAIWDDKNGKPDKLLYSKSHGNSSTNNIKTNEFNTYKLDTSLIVKGKYYVGWIQSDYFYMNVGYDQNNNSDAFTFYLFQGNWINSKLHGSLMIRPVFRNLNSIVLETKELISKSLTVFPNPANDYITINYDVLHDLEKTSYSIYNAKGMKVMQSTFSENNTIDVNNLTSGFYILILEQNKTNFAPVKFLIQR